MKKVLFAVLAGLTFVACLQDPHAADREANALIGTEHQIAIEVCLKQARMAKDTDADAGEIRSDFEKCMADADKSAGKK